MKAAFFVAFCSQARFLLNFRLDDQSADYLILTKSDKRAKGGDTTSTFGARDYDAT
jgi:hypothetical protein